MKKEKIISIPIVLLLIGMSIPTTATDSIADNIYEIIETFDGNILYVGGSGPENYTAIQDAINDASSGDLVFVYDDSSPYCERVLVDKSLLLIGENPETTIIDGELAGSVVNITASDVVISGFTIQNGYEGIYIQTDHNIIENNIIKDIWVDDPAFNWHHKVSAIKLLSSENPVDNNQILSNTFLDNYRGIYGLQSSYTTIFHNYFSRDEGYSQPIWIGQSSTNNAIENNTFILRTGSGGGNESFELEAEEAMKMP